MSTKTLLAVVSVIEMLLLLVVGALGDKLAEAIDLNPALLSILILLLIAILAWITFYKSRISDAERINFYLPKPKIRLTQHGITRFMWWLVYSLAALLLSGGAFHLAEELERDGLALLLGTAISGTLFFYPLFREQARESGHKTLPIVIAWILSVIYGSTGYLLLSMPILREKYLLFFIALSAITMTWMKYAYMFHIFDTVFEPWFKKLPER